MRRKRVALRKDRTIGGRRKAAARKTLLFELLAGLDTGVALATPDGVLLYANARFAELMGFRAHVRLKGLRLKDHISARSWQDFDEALRKAVEQTVQGDVTVAVEGKTRTVRLVFSLIASGRNKKIMRITASEVTELVETSKALHSSRASLQSLSARILQVEDEERRRIARDLHDNTGQEVAALSMSLHQVEAGCTGASPHVRQAIKDSEKFTAAIESQIRTLSYLLHPPLLDELGLRAAIEWFVSGFAQRSGIELQMEIPASLPRFSLLQETALFRVVQSSLANVLRHSGSGTARIGLSLESGLARLSVEDEGKGMTIHQLQAARQGLAMGVGIGGMRERLRELGGTLEVNSGPGGTQLIATLPVESKGSPLSIIPAWPVPASPLSEKADNGRKRILVVDDHEVTRQGIKTLLASQPDLEVVGEAADGLEAVTMAEELKPDLIILDLTMPRLGGLAVANEIRKSGSSEPKILIFTTHSFPGLMRALRIAGVQGYVLKEHASTDLAHGIQEVLHGNNFYCPEEIGAG